MVSIVPKDGRLRGRIGSRSWGYRRFGVGVILWLQISRVSYIVFRQPFLVLNGNVPKRKRRTEKQQRRDQKNQIPQP